MYVHVHYVCTLLQLATTSCQNDTAVVHLAHRYSVTAVKKRQNIGIPAAVHHSPNTTHLSLTAWQKWGTAVPEYRRSAMRAVIHTFVHLSGCAEAQQNTNQAAAHTTTHTHTTHRYTHRRLDGTGRSASNAHLRTAVPITQQTPTRYQRQRQARGGESRQW